MSDGREPIIDPMLEELLGCQSPPDLKQHILEAYASGKSPTADEGQLDQEARKNRDSFPKVVARSRRPRQQPVNWRPWVSAAIVLIGAGGFLAWYQNQAEQYAKQNTPPAVPERGSPDSSPPPGRALVLGPMRQEVPADPLPSSEPISVPNPGRDLDSTPEIDPEAYVNQKSPDYERDAELGPPWPDVRIVKFTNERLGARRRKASAREQRAYDLDWYVRTCRLLTGKEPSPSARKSFLRDRDREETVASLLSEGDFAATWSKRLADMLVGQFPPDNKSFSREQLEEYVKGSLEANKPYDKLVFELITAIGSNDSASSDFNPATNFLLAYQGIPQQDVPHRAVKKIEATNIVCQLFLGKQLQCAQCHEHPATKWSQEDYWQMASFFVQMRRQKLGNGKFRLVNRDFTGDHGVPEQAELTFRRGDEEVSVLPIFIDGKQAESQSGIAALFDRRKSLAQMIVNSEEFSKTTVNRLWDQAFGSGFTYPVDDIGEHNLPTHPELLDRLAAEFRNSGYDLRAALRWLTLCSAFDPSVEPATRPGLPESFVRDGSTRRNSAVEFELIGHTIRRFADSGRELAPDIAAANIAPVSEREKAEAMKRFKEKMADKLLSTSKGAPLRRIADNENLNANDKISHLFLSILGRLPTGFERKQSLRILQSGRQQQANNLREIGYILIVSQEFAVQH